MHSLKLEWAGISTKRVLGKIYTKNKSKDLAPFSRVKGICLLIGCTYF